MCFGTQQSLNGCFFFVECCVQCTKNDNSQWSNQSNIMKEMPFLQIGGGFRNSGLINLSICLFIL